VRKDEADWRQWGSGEMSWLGFSLYRATLWVVGEPAAELPASSPSALQLDYQRDIPRDRLVQTSVDEMRRLGASEAQLQRWEPELRRVFPDVKEGDSIIGVHYPGRGAAFLPSRPPDRRGARCGVRAPVLRHLARPSQPQPESAGSTAQATGQLNVSTPPDAAAATRHLLAYGALGLPLAMAALPVYVHVPRLYAEAAGMSLSLLGALLLAARCSTPVLIRCSVAGATARRVADV
jgi:hypothetical protein